MTDTPDIDRVIAGINGHEIAETVHRHADTIMRASGSGLRNYEQYGQRKILAAVMDLYEEAYLAGAVFALTKSDTKGPCDDPHHRDNPLAAG